MEESGDAHHAHIDADVDMDLDARTDASGGMAVGGGNENDGGDGDGGGMQLDDDQDHGSGERDMRPGHRFGKRRVDRLNSGSGEGGGGGDDNEEGSGSGSRSGIASGIRNAAESSSHSVNPAIMNKAFGGQTWMDFLRESGQADDGQGQSEGIGADMASSNGLRAPPHTTRRPPPAASNRQSTISNPNSTTNIPTIATNRDHPLPPLPVDERHPHTVDNNRPFRSYSGSHTRALPPLPALPTHSHSEQRPPTRPQPASSGDRKRRLTTADTPVRRGSGVHSVDLGYRGAPPAPSSLLHPSPHYHPPGSGSTSSDPILLDSSSPNMRPRPGWYAQSPVMATNPPAPPPRRESDLVLPPWQPDADVTHCFVCGSQFTFFYRKHHCRKCGRVVCAACSPHRITIPRQFIVHPPSEMQTVIDLTADDDDANTMSPFGPFRNPALGGGEEVRVCNPCVPDPNYNPPPPYTPQQASPSSLHHTGHPTLHPANARRTGYPRTHTNYNPGYTPRNMAGERPPSGRGPDGSSAPLHSPLSSTQTPYNPYIPSLDPRARPHVRSTSNAQTPRLRQSRYYATPYASSFADTMASAGVPTHHPFPGASPTHPAPPPPRREIAEEDECPICGNELPPKGPDGDEAARIQHVEDCIALHSSSPPPVSNAQQQQQNNISSTSLPSQRTRGMSNAATLLNSASPAAGNGEGASGLNSNRMSMSARGMYVYTATEKDCVNDDDGEEAECIICFEEFEAGDKMGRLVCFCKFHEVCFSLSLSLSL